MISNKIRQNIVFFSVGDCGGLDRCISDTGRCFYGRIRGISFSATSALTKIIQDLSKIILDSVDQSSEAVEARNTRNRTIENTDDTAVSRGICSAFDHILEVGAVRYDRFVIENVPSNKISHIIFFRFLGKPMKPVT